MHDRNYRCQVTYNDHILITNKKGECITSDILMHSNEINKKQKIFAKKILSFAEIALGKAA